MKWWFLKTALAHSEFGPSRWCNRRCCWAGPGRRGAELPAWRTSWGWHQQTGAAGRYRTCETRNRNASLVDDSESLNHPYPLRSRRGQLTLQPRCCCSRMDGRRRRWRSCTAPSPHGCKYHDLPGPHARFSGCLNTHSNKIIIMMILYLSK